VEPSFSIDLTGDRGKIRSSRRLIFRFDGLGSQPAGRSDQAEAQVERVHPVVPHATGLDAGLDL
jgi:hypothetical protein